LVGDRNFAMRDSGHFYYPLFQWCCGEWAAGRVPLWNPLENCGLPVLADATSSVFYPGKLLFLLPVDYAFGYKLYIILHVVLAAAGAYRLARHFQAGPEAAALAAIAYSCGGNVVFQYCNVVFLVGAAWLPFATIAADRMLRSSCTSSAIQLGLILALMILGGDPQAAYHVLLTCALYAALLSWTGKNIPVDRRFRWQSLFHRGALIGVAAGAAFLLAAVQTLPSAEATRGSERAAFNRPRNVYEVTKVAWPREAPAPQGETLSESIVRGLFADPEPGTHHEMVYEFSVGPWRMAEYVWPNVFGRMFPTYRRWIAMLPAEGRAWTPTLYLGLFPFLLAITGLRFRSGTAHERWLSLVVVVFTVGSCGWYGLGWLLREISALIPALNAPAQAIGSPVGGVYWFFVSLLPAYAYFRFPAKLLTIAALGLCSLAAVQFDMAFSAGRTWLARFLCWLGVGSGITAAILWTSGSAIFAGLTLVDPLLGPFDAAGAQRDLVLAFAHTATVSLAARWLLQNAWHRPEKIAQWKLLAVLMTAVDVAAANSWLIVTAPAEIWRDESPVAKETYARRPLAGPAARLPPRVYRGNLASWSPPSFRRRPSASRFSELAQWEQHTLLPKYALAMELSVVESFGSLRSADHASFMRVAKQHGSRQPDKTLLPQATALRLLGTEFLVLPEIQQPAFAERIPADSDAWPEGAALWRMGRPQPRAWIVHDVVILPPLGYPAQIISLDEQSRSILFPGGLARDFSQSAVVESDKPPNGLKELLTRPAAQTTNLDGESCEVTHYDPQIVVIQATLARPGLVVLSDSWFPGWQATIRSQPPGAAGTKGPMKAIVLRTNRTMRGVWAPAGTSEIEFRYRPTSFLWGATVSGISWLVLAAAAGIWRLRRRGQME
jgi:hypothetical protein